VDFLISTTAASWTTEPESGDVLVTIEAALCEAAHHALDELAY